MDFYNQYSDDYLLACKKKTLYIKLKVEILDHYENVITEVTQDISSNNNGTISVNYNQGVRRTCSFTLNNIDKQYLPTENSWFWINRKFKLYIGLQDDGNIYWWSQGVYITRTISTNDNTVTIDGIDKFGFFTSDLNQSVLQGEYIITNDQGSITSVIKSILMLDMGNGFPIDPIDPIISPEFSNQAIPYDIKKSSGDTLDAIIIELSNALGADIWYDNDGHLNMSKIVDDNVACGYIYMAHQWDFDESDCELISSGLDFNLGEITNAITVTSTETMQDNGKIYSYTAENNNASSPVRISSIGKKFSQVVETPMANTYEKCRQYANYLLYKNIINSISSSFTCTIIPHLDVNRVIGITLKEYNFNREPFVVQSITFPFGLGEVNINATKVQWIPIETESSSISLQNDSNIENSYSLFYDINGATGYSPTIHYFNPNDLITLSDNLKYHKESYVTISEKYFNKTGYDLIAWKDDMLGNIYAPKSQYRMPSQNIVMTAQWYQSCILLESIVTNNTITLPPISRNNYSHIINFGDGNVELGSTSNINHTYSSNSTYAIRININNDFTTIPNGYLANDTFINKIELPDCIDTIEPYAFVYSSITSVVFSANISEIPDGLFLGNTKLKSLDIPETISKLNNVAFFGCSKLENINIPESIYSIGSNCFSGCSKLKQILLPQSIMAIGAVAFQDCSSLTSFSFPNNVQYLGNSILNGCTSINNITIGDNFPVESIYEQFNSLVSLENISVSSLNTILSSINGVLFSKNYKTLRLFPINKSLSSYIIPDTVETIDQYAFINNKNLTDITLQNVITIEDSAFSNCKLLSNVILSNTLISIKTNAFINCNMTSITIPKSVTFIGDHALGYKTATTKIDGFTIYGYYKSAAITYAINNNFNYVILDAVPISNCTLTINNSTEYRTFSGNSISAIFTLSYDGANLIENTDYTVRYSNNINAGTANMEITGLGLYYQTMNTPYEILPKNIEDLSVTMSTESYPFTSYPIIPDVNIQYNQIVLNKNIDYLLSYNNNIEIGEATINILGTGNYTGSKTKTFTIYSDFNGVVEINQNIPQIQLNNILEEHMNISTVNLSDTLLTDIQTPIGNALTDNYTILSVQELMESSVYDYLEIPLG